MKKISNIIPWRRKSAGLPGPLAPFAGLETLHRQINDLFDAAFAGRDDWGWPWPAAGRQSHLPRLDVAETDKAVEVTAELPGLDEKDIQVTLDGRMLRICGEKKKERDERRKSYCLSELSCGRFERMVLLPAEVDYSKAKAVFKKGVLRLDLPKSAAAKSQRKQIAIEPD